MTWTEIAIEQQDKMTTTTYEAPVDGGKLVRVRTVYRVGIQQQVAEALTFVPEQAGEKSPSRKRKSTDKEA
jgi:hypothetical protein